MMVESYCCNRKYYTDFHQWKDDYIKYLKKEISKNIYRDPDGKKFKMLDYYKQLAVFLNQREKEVIEEEKRFIYEADNYDDIGVLICVKSKVENGEEETFYLQSDQFGFSAPDHGKKHIYDIYLEESTDNNKEENVAKWIWESRTIGGSFLWPTEEWRSRNPIYNIQRGKYREDRCDLTLLEIRGCYDKRDKIGKINGKDESNFLYREINMGKYKNMEKWLKHFGSFDKYVEYFCFDSFIECDDKGKTYPINLYEPEKSFYRNDELKYIYGLQCKELNCNKLGNMLESLCSRIVERSNRMEGIVSKSRKGE